MQSLASLLVPPAVACLVIALIAAVLMAVDRFPRQHSPFASFDLNAPVGLATGTKLARLRDDPAACRALVEQTRMQVSPVADRREGSFCALTNVVAIERSAIAFSGPVRLTCPMAAARYLWERDVVEPAAARHFRAEVARIDHLGTYACRRIGGREGVQGDGQGGGPPSEHATANAIDVSAFRLEGGRTVSLARGWQGSADERAFLREVRDGACRLFRVVLGLDYNAAHRDHFHFDLGPYGACR